MHPLIDVSLLRRVDNFFFTLGLPGVVLGRKTENSQKYSHDFFLNNAFFESWELAETRGQLFFSLRAFPGCSEAENRKILKNIVTIFF